MTRRRRLGLIVLIAAVAGAAGFWAARGFMNPAPPAPVSVLEMSFSDLKGHPHRLSQWRGNVVLVNFWATWCGPCREEIPMLEQAQARWGKDGLQIIGIAIDTLEPVVAYHRERPVKYPILIGETDPPTYPDAIALMAEYGNPAGYIPYSVILDRDGRVSSRQRGAYKAAELEAALSKLLQEPAKTGK